MTIIQFRIQEKKMLFNNSLVLISKKDHLFLIKMCVSQGNHNLYLFLNDMHFIQKGFTFCQLYLKPMII